MVFVFVWMVLIIVFGIGVAKEAELQRDANDRAWLKWYDRWLEQQQ
jgi:hypothetical protein